ncbi:MAG: hypothetical protein AOA65_0592 [Candidatus Bathyarchaeota archaeon BA1]|nr:MAG: hypothetical protein AOA65_0592 [Candidatus Bathyarchaeota archaeon BA1]
MRVIEENLRSRIRKLEVELKVLRENELPHLNERISELEELIKRKRSPKEFYEGLIGVLSLLSFICVFSTVTGFFSLTLGSFLSAACLIALLLFVIAR